MFLFSSVFDVKGNVASSYFKVALVFKFIESEFEKLNILRFGKLGFRLIVPGGGRSGRCNGA